MWYEQKVEIEFIIFSTNADYIFLKLLDILEESYEKREAKVPWYGRTPMSPRAAKVTLVFRTAEMALLTSDAVMAS